MNSRSTLLRFTLVLLLGLAGSGAGAPVATDSPDGCCVGKRGNVNSSGIVDLVDLSALVNYLTGGGYVPPCMDAANINGTGIVDLVDLSSLVNYLTVGAFVLPNCPNTSMTYAARQVAFAALDSVAAGLGGVSPDSLAKVLTAFFGTRSEFEAHGQDGTSVWARFKDGRLLVIPNNRIPTGSGGMPADGEYQVPDSAIPPGFVLPKRRFASWDPATSVTAPQMPSAEPAYELPSAIQARIISTLGSPCFTTGKVKARALLADAGYELASSDGTVPGLLAVAGDGVFCIDAHCGKGQDRAGIQGVGCIWTNTLVSAAGDSTYGTMLDSAELVYMWANDLNGGACSVHERYAFTGKFAAQYMSFAKNSFVFINACTSDNATIKAGFTTAGASVYAGWTLPVTDDPANIASEYLLDRMLGANKSSLTATETPLQRPFDVTRIWQNMKDNGFETDGSNGSKLIISELKDDFELLAPSIATMFVHPYDKTLFLYGMFGSNPGGDGQVTVGGVPLPIVSWGHSAQYDMDTIVCTIEDDGAGSAGDVQVSVRTIKSNVTQLSRYKGKFTLTHESGDGRKFDVVLDLQFRVHLLPFRTEPGKDPVYNQTTYVVHADMGSSGVDSCHGVTNFPDGSSVSWVGTDDLYNNIDGSGATKSYIAGAWFDPEHKKMQIYLSGGVQDGITQIFRDKDGNVGSYKMSIIYGLDQFDGKKDNFPSYAEVSLGPDFSIIEGSSAAKTIAITYGMLVPFSDIVKIKWDGITCEYPPNPQAPRGPEAIRQNLMK